MPHCVVITYVLLSQLYDCSNGETHIFVCVRIPDNDEQQQEHRILLAQRVGEVDYEIIKFNQLFCGPDWLLFQVLSVPHNDVLKRQDALGVREYVLEELVDILQFHETITIVNEVFGQPQADQKFGKLLKSFRQRLVGKAGRVHGSSMGKQCDFSARNVIGVHPNLSIDQAAVSCGITSNLTYHEHVTKCNLQNMTNLVANRFTMLRRSSRLL